MDIGDLTYSELSKVDLIKIIQASKQLLLSTWSFCENENVNILMNDETEGYIQTYKGR